ncbi:MAG: hypothetical protein U0869_23230 [Chloroflexota bacterium]
MTDERGAALIERLDAAEGRLRVHAGRPLPGGETEPSEGGEETWGAAQVWGHLSEFPAYWTAAARRILAAPVDAPASFGRTTTDPSRVVPIAGAAGVPVAELFARCSAGIAEARMFIAGLSGGDWDRIGVHVVRGEIPMSGIMERMIAGHLEEHAAQLDRLAAEAGAGG